MGTTAEIVDSTQRPDRSPCDKPQQEMDDALLHYWPSFYRSAFRYLGNAADAEDAVQDALLAAYKHLSQFRRQARMSTWLTAIVINSARMELRRRPRRPHVSIDDELAQQESRPLRERLADRGPSPEEACRRAEVADQILQFARQLSPTLRRTFQLRHLEGLSIRETADVLGVVEGTVKAQLARARAKLKLLMRNRPSRKPSEIFKVNHMRSKHAMVFAASLVFLAGHAWTQESNALQSQAVATSAGATSDTNATGQR
jgi:RNA polymerase sigma-70 factor (ECF subfamily)